MLSGPISLSLGPALSSRPLSSIRASFIRAALLLYTHLSIVIVSGQQENGLALALAALVSLVSSVTLAMCIAEISVQSADSGLVKGEGRSELSEHQTEVGPE